MISADGHIAAESICAALSAAGESGHATPQEDGPGLTPERSFLVQRSIVCLANVYASEEHRRWSGLDQ
jgi:hypothetical protein